MPKTTFHVLTLVAAPLAVVAAIPAHAAPARHSQSIEVAVGDLDLATPNGQKTLQARIDRAARAVCGVDQLPTGSHIPSRDAMNCYRQAQRSAAERVADVADARQAHGG